MLHKLFQKHETFACYKFTNEKVAKAYFMPLSGIKYFLPCNFWPWHETAKSV